MKKLKFLRKICLLFCTFTTHFFVMHIVLMHGTMLYYVTFFKHYSWRIFPQFTVNDDHVSRLHISQYVNPLYIYYLCCMKSQHFRKSTDDSGLLSPKQLLFVFLQPLLNTMSRFIIVGECHPLSCTVNRGKTLLYYIQIVIRTTNW